MHGDLRDDRRGGARGTVLGTIAGTLLFGLVGLLLGSLLSVGWGIGLGILFGVLALVPAFLISLVASSGLEIVPAYENRTLTVLGDFKKVLTPGLNVVPPLVSETTAFDMRTQTVDVPSQEAITQDNSPVVANAIVYIRVRDAEKAFLEVEDYKKAVSNLAQTTLRAVLGDMELDETLSRRRDINERIREGLAGPTDEWGVEVESVEVQEITPSKDVLRAMEQQTSAERRRRAMILEAQGERRSDVEKAQGDKESDIIRAQGEKQAQILEAQGDAISTVLRSRSAEAMGERAVIDKGLESLASIGQAESTTYVMPQELTSTLGRYGKHLTGADAAEGQTEDDSLLPKEFDGETRELLGLDDIEDIAAGVGGGNGTADDVADSEVAAIREADDSHSEVESLREADDDVDEVESLREADDGGAGVEGVAEADAVAEMESTAADAQSTFEGMTERMESSMADVTPDAGAEADAGADPASGSSAGTPTGAGADAGSGSEPGTGPGVDADGDPGAESESSTGDTDQFQWESPGTTDDGASTADGVEDDVAPGAGEGDAGGTKGKDKGKEREPETETE